MMPKVSGRELKTAVRSTLRKPLRYIRSKLSEADQQLGNSSCGIVHIGIDADREGPAANLRRSRNIDGVRGFRPESNLQDVFLHYFQAHITETSAWTIYETTDCF